MEGDFDLVTGWCSGLQSCNIEVTTQFPSDPCIGTRKYLEVEYTCASSEYKVLILKTFFFFFLSDGIHPHTYRLQDVLIFKIVLDVVHYSPCCINNTDFQDMLVTLVLCVVVN